MFHISENNIHCGYSFEWPWPDDSIVINMCKTCFYIALKKSLNTNLPVHIYLKHLKSGISWECILHRGVIL